ncbi:quinone oxidoreductase family protein [Bradyrhizobium commune]|uniref:Quinone oxidoreductase n=1 Tax=Bradyrhizobium commune TaxID=83627 RepID=A0A7S9D3T5_9BRAD|nr:quinone oxidoreductase [Bradyrhizobium commune]QPF90695.1 quinone oxidoreductase [Bradyrhizobium commune]
MRAIVMDKTGGPEVLQWREVAEPEPAEDEVTVNVRAVGLNFRDIYFRRGMYPAPPGFIPGQEAAGVIREVGAKVSGYKVGDRVVVLLPHGAYAERIVVPVGSVAKVPDWLSLEHAAALELQGLTAHAIMTSCVHLRPGDWVVIHAAAGGLGLLLTRLAKYQQANIVGTVSTPAKADAARAAGTDRIASYDNFGEVVAEVTGGVGAAAVLDGIGAATFERSLGVLSGTGTLVLFGWVSGPVKAIDLDLMQSRSFVRPRLGDFLTRGEFARRLGEVFHWTEAGVVKPTVGARFRLSQAAQAQRALESREVTGKVLLIPDSVFDRNETSQDRNGTSQEGK